MESIQAEDLVVALATALLVALAKGLVVTGSLSVVSLAHCWHHEKPKRMVSAEGQGIS